MASRKLFGGRDRRTARLAAADSLFFAMSNESISRGRQQLVGLYLKPVQQRPVDAARREQEGS